MITVFNTMYRSLTGPVKTISGDALKIAEFISEADTHEKIQAAQAQITAFGHRWSGYADMLPEFQKLYAALIAKQTSIFQQQHPISKAS